MKSKSNGTWDIVNGKWPRHFPFHICHDPYAIFPFSARRTPRSAHCLLPSAFCFLLSAFCLLFSACTVGPKYHRPSAPVPAAYKEQPSETSGWRPAQPSDETSKGKWWTIYNDPELNALEDQVSISNQNLLAAEAQFREARAAVRIARAALFPSITGSVSIVNSGSGGATTGVVTGGVVSGTSSKSSSRTLYDLSTNLTWEADIWGAIRHSVRAAAATAQASAGQLENARLSYQAELASDYFQLRTTDANQDLLERTVKSYQDYLTLTQNRFNAGVASGADVAQAETQLDGAKAQLVDLGVARAQFQHAIAVLVGKPPAEVTVSFATLKTPPPVIPVEVPSALLERRPDIAAAERQMAAANEQIGIAKSAFYPTLTLSGSAGLSNTQFTKWISWPSRFWSVGPALAETLFDAGRRRAQVAQTQAAFDFTVANYRQIVLTSFQQVEDQLSTLRVLADEARVENDAVNAAERALTISTDQYKAGTASYLQVIISQTAAYGAERSAIDILSRRMVSSVLLIEALGGGWDATSLPTPQDVTHGT